jgi:two-component system sensor histidine kinase MprB
VRRLSFETRLTLVATVAVAAVVAIAAVVLYLVVQTVLVNEVDSNLRDLADSTRLRGSFVIVPPNTPVGGARAYYQLIDVSGKVTLTSDETYALPVSGSDVRVASGDLQEYREDTWLGGVRWRVLTRQIPGADNVALMTALPRTDVDTALATIRLVLILVAATGVAFAAVLGRLIAQAALRPINRLRQAVDHVTETSDMSERVPDQGQDELARLGAHFNRMLVALDQSLRTQRQLVADASHELRTPLASMRTNIEVLQRSPALAGPERDRLLKDVLSQVEQLTRLIQDLIDLARGDQAPEEREEVRLDWIVATAVQRAATNWPAVTFSTDLAESLVVGQSGRLDRAVSNLLDNAGKWSPPGGLVEVRVADHEVTVRDHGPGIDHADLPFVFDRFWRAPAARGMPGSGLGLSIVRQVAEAHGGTVEAELPPEGGTLMRLKLNGTGR